jgi:hypothetical protein
MFVLPDMLFEEFSFIDETYSKMARQLLVAMVV